MLTGRNVMLLNTECMWCFLEMDIACCHVGGRLGEARKGGAEKRLGLQRGKYG